jgi:heptose I phosphotransferase
VTPPQLETWDAGRVTVNQAFARLLRQHRLTTFDAVWQATQSAAVAKQLRTDRITLRFELPDEQGRVQSLYIKRHTASGWWEHLKPLLQLRRPTLGARIEWDAILAFHRAGIPTMTPVAVGVAGARSWLITAALEDCDKLSDVRPPPGTRERQQLLTEVAGVAQLMHTAGLHHQDFYLGHLLKPRHHAGALHVIDLGRAERHGPWWARRWIVKDLAQLNYSAKDSPATERLRFLKAYLGRPLCDRDRGLIRSILRKTRRIASHSRKHGL